jgi:hypothetical protein
MEMARFVAEQLDIDHATRGAPICTAVLSWFNSGLNGQGRPLAGLGRSPRVEVLTNA